MRKTRHLNLFGCLALSCLILCGGTELFANQTEIVPGEYVKVKSGHLSYNGKRLRLWGTNFCHRVNRQGRDLELEFDRLQFLGFNGIRTNYTSFIIQNTFDQEKTSVVVPVTVKGSGTNLDRLDHAIFLAKQRGMFFWTEFNQYRQFKPGDYDLLQDNGTRKEWEALIKAQGSGIDFICYIDSRAEELVKIYARNLLNHLNPYTGKKYAEEEAIGLYQLFNESNAIGTLLSQKFDGPIGECIQKRWNQWLTQRYGSDGNISKAWGVKLNGESLKDGTIKYGPLPNASKTELAGYQTEYKNTGAPVAEQYRRRQEDIMRFVYNQYEGFNSRLIAYIRTLAPKGVGVNVVPITPTGRYGNDFASYYGASKGDFVSVGGYGFSVRPWMVPKNDPYYPYTVRVNSHPMMETPNDVCAVEGKPYLIYETNDYRPNPYMTEFVLRTAINAILNDADGVFWFNADDAGYIPNLRSDNEYCTADLPIPDTGYPNAGIIMAVDQMELATIQSAGLMFLKSNLPSFAAPKITIIGKDILLDINRYGDPGRWVPLTYIAWSDGLKLRYDLTRNSSIPSLKSKEKGNILKANNWAVFDWNNKRGSITVNTNKAKAFSGFTAKDMKLGDVEIKGINRDFGYVGLIAEDGNQFVDSNSILLTMTAYSTKEGLKLEPNPQDTDFSNALARSIKEKGGKVLNLHLAAGVSAPWMKGRWYRKYDFARRCYEEGIIQGELKVGETEPFFCAKIFKDNPNQIKDVMYIGNSITRHGPSETLGWKNWSGMAASSEEKDYAHQSFSMLTGILSAQPVMTLQCISDEGKMAGWDNIRPGSADLIIIELGDNYRGKVTYEDLQLNYERMIAGIKGTREPIVVCVGTWGNSQLDHFIKKAAENQGALYVDIGALSSNPQNRATKEFSHPGVQWHPNDVGMKAIAEAIFKALEPVLKKKKLTKLSDI